MVNLAPAGSLWAQVANFSFFCAGVFADILLVRFFLLLAFALLLLNSILGFPFWPKFAVFPISLSLDSILWFIAGIYVHGSELVRLLSDEIPVVLNDEEEALWRLFFRYSGLSKVIFQSDFLSRDSFVSFEPGDKNLRFHECVDRAKNHNYHGRSRCGTA